MDARIGQSQPAAGWMTDRNAAAVRTEVRAEDMQAWPARPTVQRSQQEQIREQAQKWVAQTFFGTMLKQMRNSPFKSELFSGGRGGEAFTSMFDQHLADRMARGAGRRLSDSIARQLSRRSAAEVSAEPRLGGTVPSSTPALPAITSTRQFR